MPYFNVKDVKSAAQGRWDSILGALAPSLAPALERPGRHCPCPVHGGKSGDAFRVFKDVAQSGGGVCNTCGPLSDGFKLLAWANGQTFAEVLAEVAGYLGVEGEGGQKAAAPPKRRAPPPRAPLPPPQQEDPAIRERLRSVYAGSYPVTDLRAEAARAYLRGRGLHLVPSMLRMHPGLFWRDQEGNKHGPFPTLISLVTDPQGRGVTLHRIYLDPTGKKAPVPEPKKLMSHPSTLSMKGAAIRLFPPGSVLGVAEGIETAIAVTEATGIPCWPTISSALLPSFERPSGVERLIVFADKDRPTQHAPEGTGLKAAKKLVTRLWSEGCKASIALPPSAIPDGAKSVDWLDEYVQHGRARFKEAIAA